MKYWKQQLQVIRETKNVTFLHYLGDEPEHLDTSRLITTDPIGDQVDFTELFPTIFKSITGQLVQATPKIQTVQIHLSKPEQLGYHEGTLNHAEETD